MKVVFHSVLWSLWMCNCQHELFSACHSHTWLHIQILAFLYCSHCNSFSWGFENVLWSLGSWSCSHDLGHFPMTCSFRAVLGNGEVAPTPAPQAGRALPSPRGFTSFWFSSPELCLQLLAHKPNLVGSSAWRSDRISKFMYPNQSYWPSTQTCLVHWHPCPNSWQLHSCSCSEWKSWSSPWLFSLTIHIQIYQLCFCFIPQNPAISHPSTTNLWCRSHHCPLLHCMIRESPGCFPVWAHISYTTDRVFLVKIQAGHITSLPKTCKCSPLLSSESQSLYHSAHSCFPAWPHFLSLPSPPPVTLGSWPIWGLTSCDENYQ